MARETGTFTQRFAEALEAKLRKEREDGADANAALETAKTLFTPITQVLDEAKSVLEHQGFGPNAIAVDLWQTNPETGDAERSITFANERGGTRRIHISYNEKRSSPIAVSGLGESFREEMNPRRRTETFDDNGELPDTAALETADIRHIQSRMEMLLIEFFGA